VATFTAWKFDNPDGAEHAAEVLKNAASEGLIKILDHAVVSWPVGSARPKMKQSRDSKWHDTGWGAFWGFMVGALFLVPVVGAAAGAGLGVLHHATEGVGIDKDQLEKIQSEVTEGTSALLAFTEDGNLDRVGERFHGMHWTLVESNLTDGERRMLLETFGGG
jgi:uncharacterized membrane protein